RLLPTRRVELNGSFSQDQLQKTFDELHASSPKAKGVICELNGGCNSRSGVSETGGSVVLPDLITDRFEDAREVVLEKVGTELVLPGVVTVRAASRQLTSASFTDS